MKGIIKLISDIELLHINLAICGSMQGLPHLSFTKYQTCVNIIFSRKKEPEQMHFIADTKFPPFDLCLNSSCIHCVFSSYHMAMIQ